MKDNSSIQAYYSKGMHKKAILLSHMVEEGYFFLKGLFGTEAKIVLLVLGINDWKKHIGSNAPYFVPSYSRRFRCIYAGDKIEQSVMEPFLRAFKSSPTDLRRKLVSVLGATKKIPETGLQTLFDYLVVHELAHGFADAKKVNMGTFWLSEFLADYCMYAFAKSLKSTQIEKTLDVMYQMIYEGGYSFVEHRSLADLEKMYSQVGIFNYEWYHAKFHIGIRELYKKFGTSFITTVIQEFEASDEKVVSRIDKRLNGFRKWFRVWK
jgi:hypothetical protein